MTLQIRPAAASTSGTSASASARQRLHPLRDIGKALKAGDLAAASKAYDAIVAKAPERVANNPDGPFAQLGAALAAGDLAAARTAYANVFTSHLQGRSDDLPVAAGASATTPLSTSAGSGRLLDISA